MYCSAVGSVSTGSTVELTGGSAVVMTGGTVELGAGAAAVSGSGATLAAPAALSGARSAGAPSTGMMF